MRRVSLHPYLNNVRVTVWNNVRWFLEHVVEEKEDSEAERFLLAVIGYCQGLISDPGKRERKRVRTRHGPAPGRDRPGSGSSGKVAAAERPG